MFASLIIPGLCQFGQGKNHCQLSIGYLLNLGLHHRFQISAVMLQFLLHQPQFQMRRHPGLDLLYFKWFGDVIDAAGFKGP